MHLHDLGNIGNTTSIIDSVLGSIGDINRKNYANAVDVLKTSLKDCSLETVKLVLAQESLSKVQIKAILAAKGLQGEELKLAVAELTADAATKKLTLSTASLTTIMQGLKTAVLTNPLLMATAVVAGLFAVYKVVDLLTVSFEEQKEIVNDLTSEVNDLQSEYDKLKADPSVNGSKLSALKRELEIKKDILEIEKETLALKDMQENMPDISNKTGTSGGHVNPTWTPEDTAETDIRGDLQKLYQARNNMSNIDSIIPVAQDMVMQGYVQQEADALKELSEHTNTLQKEYLEIADAKAKLEQYVEDGTLKGVNADLARKQIAEYQAEIDRLDPIILEAELELGTASYLEAYNKLWDTIQDAGSHPTARDGVMPLDDIDDLITKTQELNQAFLDGETTAKEYLDSISNLISDSGLENALSNVGSWEGASTDYLEQVVSGLATQVSDSLMEFTGRFMRDESTVQEYVDELESAAEAEMKLLKGLHKLEPATEDGQVNLEGLTDEALEAAKAYNELENNLDDLQEVDAMIEVNTNYADLIADYENWTEDMLDTEPIQNYVKEMSAAIAQYAQENKDSIDTIVADLTEATGVAIEKEKLLSTNAASYLQDVCGNSIVAVHGMVVYSTGETTKVVTNASQALGGVLEALGNMIENFEYTITATPRVVVDPKIETDENGVPHLQLGSYELKFSGKGGQSVQDFSTALKGAASYFENNDVFGEKLNNVDSYKRKGGSDGSLNNGTGNNNGTGHQNPTGTGKTGGSSSKKDPHIAEVDKYKNLTDTVDEYDRKLQQLERTYDNTDSVEERIGLKKAEIKLYKEQKDAIDALNKARDEEISGLVNKLRGQGFKIDYDPTTENLLIKNREHINDLNQSIIEQYEEYIKRVDELNDANKDSADQWDELTSSIVKAGKELKDLEQEKFEDYIEGAEHLLRLMESRKDAFGKESAVYTNMMEKTLLRWKDLVTTDYKGNIDQIRELEEQWMDFYDARIEKEKEILEMQLDDNDRVLDGVIKVIDDQIKALDDQIDGLSKANDERKKALELQKAQAELDKARNQKTRHVLRKDVGWVWESDDDAIKEGEENLSDLKYESKVDALEDEKEALEDLKEKWEEIPDIAEDEQNRLLMIEKLGADAESDILNDRIDVYEDFKDDYIDIQEQIQDKTDELEEHTSQAYLNVVKAFENMAKLAGIGLDTGVTTQKTQSAWYVNKDGKAPSQANVGDLVYTKGGIYRIDSKDENGKFKSTRIDATPQTIPEGMWGKEIEKANAGLTYALDKNVLSNQSIVDASNEQIEQIKRAMIASGVLNTSILEGKEVTEDEIKALIEQTEYVNNNSLSIKGNTVQMGTLTTSISALTNAINNTGSSIGGNGSGNITDFIEGIPVRGNTPAEQKVNYWSDVLAELKAQGASQSKIDYVEGQLEKALKKLQSSSNTPQMFANSLSETNVSAMNEQIDTMYEGIAGMEAVGKYLANNTYFTQEEINTLAKHMGITDINTYAMNENADSTDANTDSQNENTDSLNNATDAIDNLSVAVRNMAYAQAEADAYNTANNMKEGVSNEKWLKYWDDVLNFSDRTGLLTQEEVNNALAQRNRYQELVNQEKAIQDMVNGVTSSTLKVDLSDEDKKIIKTLQDAYNTAKAAGNEEGMELAHQLAEAVRNGFDISPITSKPDYKLSDTTYTGGASAGTGKKSNLQKDYEWQLSKAKEFGASKDYISRLENAIARETYGSGSKIDTYTDEYGRTSTIINAADKSELNMSADDLKNRYDAGWRPVNDSMGKLGGNLNETNETLSDNSDAMYDSSDKIDSSADKIVDSNNNVVDKLDSLENAINNANFGSGDAGSTGSTGGSKVSYSSSGGTRTETTYKSDGGKTVRSSTGRTTTVTTYNKDGSVKSSYTTTSARAQVPKKAKGGLNLPEDNYIVNEKGDEAIIEPDEGNWIRLHSGSSVIPHEAAENMWEFGANPKMFLSDVLGYDAMKMNQQIIYTGSGEKVIQYNIGTINPNLPNVTKPDEFWDEFTRNLPNEAKQWGTTGY